MRLLIASDLHLERGTPFTVPPGLAYDAVILAGDIHSPGRCAVAWAQQPETFGGRPVVLVPGNHEFYGAEVEDELAATREAAADSAVHLLAPGCVVLGGVRILGCTLWTDFALPVDGITPLGTLDRRAHAMSSARHAMNDYAAIRVKPPGQARRLLTPADTLAIHHAERAWLLEQFRLPFAGPTVVVTHTGPSDGSVAPRYAADWCTPAFVSHLPDEFFDTPVLWIHGHTHTRFDYRRGACRVVSEPRGYRMRDGSWENPLFDGRLVVNVDVPVDELSALANASFESPAEAAAWLRRPHPMLGGKSPYECADSKLGAQRVKDILVAIRNGGVV